MTGVTAGWRTGFGPRSPTGQIAPHADGMTKKRKVYLHVGMPGAGDIIDVALVHHRDALVELGIDVPVRSTEESFLAAVEILREHKAWGFARKEVEGQWANVCRPGVEGQRHRSDQPPAHRLDATPPRDRPASRRIDRDCRSTSYSRRRRTTTSTTSPPAGVRPSASPSGCTSSGSTTRHRRPSGRPSARSSTSVRRRSAWPTSRPGRRPPASRRSTRRGRRSSGWPAATGASSGGVTRATASARN